MNLGIGIDTGGTYTDAVIYDFDRKEVLAKGKSLTTKENLELGIGNALDALPEHLLKEAKVISLSTTLATNACVENKGGRAKLVLVSTTRKIMKWVDAEKVYGLRDEDALCIDTESSFDGKIIDHPDWDKVMEEHHSWFAEAQALAVAEKNALRNGGACETLAKEKLTAKYPVPFVMGKELAADHNVMERGATALLNARLLPTIREFMDAVRSALEKRNISGKKMIVRSDGSLMSQDAALTYPVTTILSGPAASIMGGRAIADCPDCLIVDMGGTTTDISIVKNNQPALTDGIRIGGFRTQISGVYIDTFGLGGDSRITADNNTITLNARRVRPLCAAAAEFPQIKDALRALLESHKNSAKPLQETLYLVKEPARREDYTREELKLIDLLKDHPVPLSGGEIDLYNLSSERLESEGLIMRCGLTPTDIMHIRGDFSKHDKEASVLGARYLLRVLTGYEDTPEDLERFCEDVYQKICKKLYENILRILICNQYPKIFKNGADDQILALIEKSWEEKHTDGFFHMDFRTNASLVGIGAPTHIFLPRVAELLGVPCIIPEHAEVANAIGAIVSDISVQEKITVSPNYTSDGPDCFTMYAAEETKNFEEMEDAIRYAKELAEAAAIAKARANGALGQLTVEVKVNPRTALSKDGLDVNLGAVVIATATGRI